MYFIMLPFKLHPWIAIVQPDKEDEKDEENNNAKS